MRDQHRPVVGHVEHVKLYGHDDAVCRDARIDTGAKRTCVDTGLAETVGREPPIETKEITTSVGETERREIVEFGLVVAEGVHVVRASVRDRSDLSYPIRLGRDVASSYLVDSAEKWHCSEPDSESDVVLPPAAP